MLEGARLGDLRDKATSMKCRLYSALSRIPAFVHRHSSLFRETYLTQLESVEVSLASVVSLPEARRRLVQSSWYY